MYCTCKVVFLLIRWIVVVFIVLVVFTLNAYHLYGKPGNSGENSNGTVHPGGNFRKKSDTFRGITNDTNQSRSCFRCQEIYQYHLTEIFHRNCLVLLDFIFSLRKLWIIKRASLLALWLNLYITICMRFRFDPLSRAFSNQCHADLESGSSHIG